MKRILVATSIAMGASIAAQNVAAAQSSEIPPACAGRREAMFYERGVDRGRLIVAQSWASINDCGEIDYFFDILADNVSRLTLREGASLSLACMYSGTTDGVFDALGDLYGECSDLCFLDGTMAGELSAQIYCDLSIAFGGLIEPEDFVRGPVQTCGFNFEVGCDVAFVEETMSYVDPLGNACLPYTQDPHFDVWDATRNNMCLFELPEEPDTVAALTDDEQGGL